MSLGHSVGVREPPGRVDGGWCADCPSRLEADHDLRRDAVYRVPDPRFSVATTTLLCPYHLARFANEHEDLWHRIRSHSGLSDPADVVQEPAFVTLRDVPTEIEIDGDRWHRLGLDEVGRAHFTRDHETGVSLIVTIDAEFDVLDRINLKHRPLTSWVSHVEDDVGWLSIDEQGGDGS